jgi:hypothetical protein
MQSRGLMHRFARSSRFGTWGILLTGLLATGAASADPVHNTDTATDYLTIQAAIDDPATLNGHHIVVDAGTYIESLTLGKRLFLSGAQAGNSGCGRVTGAPNPVTESIITQPTSAAQLVNLVTGCAGSVIDGFSFIGGQKGIFLTSGPGDDLVIKNNHFAGFVGNAIFLNRLGRDITIDRNNVDGSSKTSGGGSVHLDTKVFDGFYFTNNCVGNDPLGTGFFSDGVRTVLPSVNRSPLFDGNLFEKHTANAGVNIGRGSFSDATISNNIFRNNKLDGLQGGAKNTAIHHNLFTTNGRWGLALTGLGATTGAPFSVGTPAGAINCNVHDNTFTANDSAGLFISASMLAGNAGSNHSNHNDIVGNNAGGSKYGALYRGGETIDVACNWWGHIDGPNYPPTNPNPPADGIFAPSATFVPWLDGSISGSPNCNQSPPVNTTTTLSSDINPSSCGQKVMLTATVSPNTATGTVEFFDGGASIGTASVVAGAATLSYTFVSGGHHPLTATYGGDPDNNPSTSGLYVQNVHCAPTGTTTVLTTPCDTQEWFPTNIQGAGTVAITGTYPHATGSLEFNSTGGSDKADYARFNVNADLLSTLSAIAVDLYRNSTSTTAAHFAPAVRIQVYNGQATDHTSYLIWEPVYNGVPTFPTNSWGTYDLFKGNFWQRAFKTTPPNKTIDIYNRTLADWLQPGTVTDGDGDVSNVVGPNARVIRYEIGVGSGWSDTFAGAADNFRIGFSGADSVFDFETTQQTSLVLSAPASSTCGDKVTLSADLTPAGLVATIDFYDGATLIGSMPVDGSGHAELSVTGLAAGAHSFKATYAGAPCVDPATSNTVAHQVDLIPTTTTLDAQPATSAYGEKVTLTADVTPGTGGTVSFYDQTGPPKSLFKADPTPTPQTDPTPVNIGMRFFSDVPGIVTSIRYWKDAGNNGTHTVALWTDTGTLLATATNTPSSGDHWEDVPITPVAIAANTNYITAYHSASGFSYTVNYFDAHQEDNAPLHAPENTGGAPNGVYVYGAANQFPTGNYIGSNYWVDVAFKPATFLGTEPLSGGQAVLSTNTLEVGAHSLVAIYSGAGCYAGSASTKTAQEVTQATPIVTLDSDNQPAERNEKINFTATLSPSDATGTVEFFDGASSLGPAVPVTAGSASISVSDLSAGSHSITATYSGDSHYTTATSNKFKQDVDLIPTTTSLTSAPNPSDCGEKVLFTATVDPNLGSGTVEFFDGATSLGNGTPTGPGTYELSTSSLSAGVTHSITAVYSGDGKYAGSTSDPLLQQVDKLPVTVVLESSDPDIKEGNKITLTATITPAAASGTVDFKDGATPLGTAPVTAGQAMLSVATLDPGSHTLTAEYSGDACYQSRVSDPIKQDIQVDDTSHVEVITPNGGENWVVNTTHKVSWTATDDNSVAYVDLYLSRDNGVTYELIADMEDNDGTYDWLVSGPGTNTDATPVYSAFWRIVATDDANQTGEDVSDAPFSIFDGATPVLLSMFIADPTPSGIELRWSFATPGQLRDVTLERADRLDGVWMHVDAETRREGEQTVALDRTTTPGATYYYRLVAMDASNRRVVFGPLSGTAGAALTEFALNPANPNPTSGRTSISFAVPKETRLRLTVVDVQGRQVAGLADGIFRTGRYHVTWDGTGDRGPAPVGLYFLRLSAGGRTFIQRLVLAR